LPRSALLIGIENTLTLALASTIADRAGATDDERSTIFFEIQSGIQFVSTEVLSRHRHHMAS
jgi:hypothetical protein